MRPLISACLPVAMCCVAVAAPGQQTPASTGAGDPSAAHAAPSPALPPPPHAPIGSGDSAARAARAAVYLTRGNAALASGMRDTARIAWEDALYENPALTDASLQLAQMLVDDGQGFFAQRVLQRALTYDPHNPKLLHFRAVRAPAADSGAHQ
jgi:Flp pilus assembly protein TadD